MAVQTGGGEKMHEIDLTTLTFPQLNQLKNQVDQQCELFQNSLETLKLTQTKFLDSGSCLSQLEPSGEGAPVLIPLSSSLYVPGRIADPDHCIVNIGTGYYVKKTVDEGKQYFTRKVNYVAEQIERIQVLLIEKVRVRDTIVEVIELKAQQANAAAGAAGTANA